jgi:hypothetical protein
VFRHGSESWFEFFREARALLREADLSGRPAMDQEIVRGDLGEFGLFRGESVPLDLVFARPMEEAEYQGKTVRLNHPRRGGRKKYYVFVRDPKTGNVKRVSFGAHGMSVKIRDPQRRKSFAARHKCAQSHDKTSANYWSCRLPHFAQSVGLAPVSAQWW